MMEEKKINAIIQARIGSTRLPGKILIRLEGVPILEHAVRRLRAVHGIDQVIIATSLEPADDAVEEFCRERNISCVRGSEENVLERFCMAAERYPADTYIRATADNPMIDVSLIDRMLEFYFGKSLTYTCYKNYPIGSGVEIFSAKALREAWEHADKPYELEHVTPYMYQRMPEGKVEYYFSPSDDSKIRMTVDTEQDLQFAKEMFRRLYHNDPFFGISEIKEVLAKEPQLKQINEGVHQKKLGE